MYNSSWNPENRTCKCSVSATIEKVKNIWIGVDVRKFKGVVISNNSIVVVNSLVTKDISANCIVAGNPAKVVKTDI